MPLLAVTAQTRVVAPKNKYKIQDDVKAGREAAAQVDRQFPILNDYETTRYVENVGRRLVAAIPSEFQQPAFQYSFKVVNARDINAFALPELCRYRPPGKPNSWHQCRRNPSPGSCKDREIIRHDPHN